MVCQKCKQPITLSQEILKEFEGEFPPGEKIFGYEGKGCTDCNFTGFSGRQGIFEFLLMHEDIRQLVMKRVTANEIREAAIKHGMKTLRQSGWEKVKKGFTTPQEVIRVTQEENN